MDTHEDRKLTDLFLFGTHFDYDGQCLDPTKVVQASISRPPRSLMVIAPSFRRADDWRMGQQIPRTYVAVIISPEQLRGCAMHQPYVALCELDEEMGFYLKSRGALDLTERPDLWRVFRVDYAQQGVAPSDRLRQDAAKGKVGG